MTCDLIRQAILTQQRHELAGIGLVESTLDRRAVCSTRFDSISTSGCSIDKTLAHLSRLIPGRLAVELDYPWGTNDGPTGALLGIIPEQFDEDCAYIETWREDDAA